MTTVKAMPRAIRRAWAIGRAIERAYKENHDVAVYCNKAGDYVVQVDSAARPRDYERLGTAHGATSPTGFFWA